MSQFLLVLFFGLCYLLYLGYKKLAAPKVDYAGESDKLKDAYEIKVASLNRTIGELQSNLKDQENRALEITKELVTLNKNYEKLQFNKISSDVKLGQKTEHLLPFLESFPYKNDEIKGLFQPIDLIVFRDDEIVMVEVKSGTSQLSEKQKNIRRIIKEGKVRFEIHRVDEKGITVK